MFSLAEIFFFAILEEEGEMREKKRGDWSSKSLLYYDKGKIVITEVAVNHWEHGKGLKKILSLIVVAFGTDGRFWCSEASFYIQKAAGPQITI